MTFLSPRVGRFNSFQARLSAQAYRGTAAIAAGLRFLSNLRRAPKYTLWLAGLIALVVLKVVVSFTQKPDSLLFAWGGIAYFLLLLLAAGFALRNAIQNTLKGRLFWLFLSIAYSFWAFNQSLFVYYGLRLHIDVPDNSIADSLLFLHVALFFAAVATLPHRNLVGRKLYPALLNAFLLIIFWSFLYFYAVFPYQLFSNSPGYNLGFDVLYPLENWALILAVGFLSVRASAPWKSIYLHLLGASTLYGLSSAVANLAMDSGGYVNGKLYGIGLSASVCWFAWIQLRARQLASPPMREIPPDNRNSKVSAWAMVAVVLIFIPIVWELLRDDHEIGVATFRVLVAIAAIVCLASVLFIKEYLAKSELAANLGSANDRLCLAMDSGKAVGWEWNLKTNQVCWFGDLKTNFGIEATTYVDRAADFFDRYICAEDREQVTQAVTDARKNRKLYHGAFRTVWPDGTLRWVTAKGQFQYSSKAEPERMFGIAIDITERRRAGLLLRETENRFRLVANTAPVLIWMSGVDKLCTFFNQGWLNFTGQSMQHELGHGWTLGVHPDDLDGCIAAYSAAFDARVDFQMEYRLRRFDGEYRWLVDFGVPRFESDGTFCGFIGSCVDITERKTSEEALHNLTSRLITAQEEERARIARELHDDFSQRLALIGIGLGQLWKRLPKSGIQERASVQEMLEGIKDMSSDLHSLSHQLHSSKLEHVGLVPALNALCKEIGMKYKLAIRFNHSDIPPKLSKDAALCLFRVAQEALGNVVKHSQSKEAQVDLRVDPDAVTLRVSDQGCGFDPYVQNSSAGIGMIGMRERLRLVSGTFSVNSKPDHGTEILAVVPLTTTAGETQFHALSAGR